MASGWEVCRSCVSVVNASTGGGRGGERFMTFTRNAHCAVDLMLGGERVT